MSDNKKKKPMTAADYIKNQPHLQGKHPTPTQNPYSALAEFPPLTYSKVINPDQSQTSTSKPKNPKQKTQYFLKPYYQHLQTTHFSKPVTLRDLQAYVNRVFYQTAPWPTDNISKNQTFYEYILVDSMSVEIKHHEDPDNPNQIAYSTCKIIRVASYQDLGFSTLHTQKPFSNPGFHIPGYTYTNYINAFFRTFLYRPFTHSWFIQFQFNCPKDIPSWFYEWWYWLGPVDHIYPKPILETSFPLYQKYLPQAHIPIWSKIAFHIDMGIPWICSWQFHLTQLQDQMPMSLVRQYRVKWWGSYDEDRCSTANIQKFFNFNKNIENAVRQVSRSLPTHDPQHARQLIQQYGQHPQQQQQQRSASPALSGSSGSSQKTKNKKAQLINMLMTLQKELNDSDSDEAINLGDSPMPDSEDPFGGPLAQDPNDLINLD